MRERYRAESFVLLPFVIFVILLYPFFLSGEEKRYDIPAEDSPYIGPTDAPITIVEFVDYQ